MEDCARECMNPEQKCGLVFEKEIGIMGENVYEL
jgi:hypothetical protein